MDPAGGLVPLYIFLLCIIASFIQRTTGFGFGVFIMTMLPFLMPSYGEATALSGLLALTTVILIVAKNYRLIVWKHLIPILLTFIVVSAFAVFILARTEETILKRVLGVVLIITSLYFIFFSDRIHLRPTVPIQIGIGSVSGLMGGFFGMQGPPAVLYFISVEKDKDRYMALASTYFLIGNTMMTFARAANGFVTKTVATDYLYGIGGVVIGTTLGSLVFKHIPQKVLRYIVYSYIGVSGIIVLATA
ncbi:MAG: sulfite exporter TauE/SafE family protein [Candidatus Cryptobacteroides sp.]